MKRTLFVTLLWSYTGWYAGAMAAELFGTSPTLGPLLAVLALAIVFVGKRRVVPRLSSVWAASRS